MTITEFCDTAAIYVTRLLLMLLIAVVVMPRQPCWHALAMAFAVSTVWTLCALGYAVARRQLSATSNAKRFND